MSEGRAAWKYFHVGSITVRRAVTAMRESRSYDFFIFGRATWKPRSATRSISFTLCGQRRTIVGGENHRYLPTNKIGCQFPQLINTRRPCPVFDDHVLAFDIAGFLKALQSCTPAAWVIRSCCKEAYDRNLRLPSPRRERPRRRTEPRDELAPSHPRSSRQSVETIPSMVPRERVALFSLLHCMSLDLARLRHAKEHRERLFIGAHRKSTSHGPRDANDLQPSVAGWITPSAYNSRPTHSSDRLGRLARHMGQCQRP